MYVLRRFLSVFIAILLVLSRIGVKGGIKGRAKRFPYIFSLDSLGVPFSDFV